MTKKPEEIIQIHLDMLRDRRAAALNLLEEFIRREGGSRHFGHNLAARAIEIASIDGMIETTEIFQRSTPRVVSAGPDDPPRPTVQDIADKTHDAYSFARYRRWEDVVAMLADRGLTATEIEWVLRSKAMRWAADEVNGALATAGDLKRYLDNPRNRCSNADIARMVREEGAKR
jgi:hypothetical protein